MAAPAEPALGIIIGGTDFGESDRIVHILSSKGRVACFAPAARKSRKRFGAGLQPFTTVRFELGQRRRAAGLPLLAGVEVVRGRWGLSEDLDRLALGSYACELVDRVAAEGVDTQLPQHLERCLDQALVRGASLAIRRTFEITVLAELGYAPQLSPCLQCGLPGTHLDVVRGGLFCRSHRGRGKEIGPRTRAWLEEILEDPDRGPHGPLSPEDADRAARAVGRVLDEAIVHVVGPPPLASLVLLQAPTVPNEDPQNG